MSTPFKIVGGRKRYSYFVPGRPIPLDRPRSFWNKRAWVPGIRVQSTPRVVRYKELLQLYCMKEKARPAVPLQGPVELSLRFYVKSPAPDLSNLVKIVEDALNGMAWKDDRQIKVLHAMLCDVPDKALEGVNIEYEDISATCSAPKNMGCPVAGETMAQTMRRTRPNTTEGKC